MKRYRFEVVLAVVFVGLYALFSGWHSQWGGKLTPGEIDTYMARIEKLPLPQEELDAICPRIRAWAEQDDGKPVFMFNLIHFFPEVRMFAGAPRFTGTPEEANKRYENAITGLWLSHASYPIFNGSGQTSNLINMKPERGWEHATVARYPNRRTFLKLLADPSYAPNEPYKFIAMELDLLPVTGEMVVPDLRWIVGGSLVFLFLLIGWVRAARRAGRP